jgi:hypothetical protein
MPEKAVLDKTHKTLFFPTTQTYRITKLVLLISHSEAANFEVKLNTIRRYKVLPEDP